MFKVTQIRNGFVVGVWFQSAESASDALESVKEFYANDIDDSEFLVEQV